MDKDELESVKIDLEERKNGRIIFLGVLLLVFMVISFVLAATVSKKPITYYKPTELNIIDKTFSDLEIETIKLALKQYDEIEGFSINDITVGKFNKRRGKNNDNTHEK